MQQKSACESVTDSDGNSKMFIDEKCQLLLQHLQDRRLMREANLNSKPLGDVDLKKLDSSIKKNTAFVKKLKILTEESKKSILDDIMKLNLSKYVSEVVNSLVDSVQRMKDVPAIVEVCCIMVQSYADFGTTLMPMLVAAFKSSNTGGDSSIEEDSSTSRQVLNRRRAFLRLLCELLAVGITNHHFSILDIVNNLVSIDFDNTEAAYSSTSLLVVFVKAVKENFLGYSSSYASIVSNCKEESIINALQQEIARQYVLPQHVQEEFKKISMLGYERACGALQSRHTHLKQLEEENARIMTTRGDLPEEAYEIYSTSRKNFDALHRVVVQLAEGLEMQLPEFPDNSVTRLDSDVSMSISTGQQQKSEGKLLVLFDDAETAAFYESLPDIPSLVPQVLLQGSGGNQQEVIKGEVEGYQPKINEEEEETLDQEIRDVVMMEDPMDALVKKLPNCVTKEQCDEISLGFCFINSKGNRRKMIRALCQLPKGCLQLLPYYARIAASLGVVFPDITCGVLAYLEQEFSKLQSRKDGTRLTLEPRIRNIKYLGELCKFKCAQFGVVFTTLKTLLDDFSGHNVDTACALVDAAGRFLMRLPETNARMDNMIQVMLRLKNVKNLDHRQSALVEAAYFECKPPSENANLKRKQRNNYQEFVRFLLYKKLSSDTIEEVSKKLRKLNWDEMEPYVLRKCLKIVQAKYQSIPWIAQLIALLRKYHSSLAVGLVDGVLEQIRIGLEGVQMFSLQLRVSHMKLLGELYNYRCVDSSTVFDTLHLLLFYGYKDQSLAARLDPPDNFFRIRLVTALLETCGTYFDRGSTKEKLDRFLLYFQRYILSKDDIPLDVDFVIQDLFQLLRPNMQRYHTPEEVCQAVEEMEAATQIQEVDEEEEDDSSGISEDEVQERYHVNHSKLQNTFENNQMEFEISW
eukprot:TRINITY_DN3277_c0_g2_i3.p1 TRINITY_DN3277_c0_g2~~TRINITY_DN3277_c0_g2_i3.p1  ORF type:complete len:917 (-),score=106.76 TRINITY_DN3277_c0_g2_i3:53-2803(-)